MRRPWFESGNYNAICDVCGFKRKASQIVERWDGLMVCSTTIKSGCWEPRHPQDFIKPIPDQRGLPWTRPQGEDVFVDQTFSTFFCSVEGVFSQANYGTADCAIVDNVNGGFII